MHGDSSLCLVHFAGRVKLKHLSCSPRPRPTALAKQVSSETAPWHFTLLKLLGVLGHLSDTSQSTPDRTRYICTLWLPLPIHVDVPPREARDSPSAASHENSISCPRRDTTRHSRLSPALVSPNRRVRRLANNLSAALPRPLRVPATRPLTTVVQHQTGPWSICCEDGSYDESHVDMCVGFIVGLSKPATR